MFSWPTLRPAPFSTSLLRFEISSFSWLMVSFARTGSARGAGHWEYRVDIFAKQDVGKPIAGDLVSTRYSRLYIEVMLSSIVHNLDIAHSNPIGKYAGQP